MIATMAKRVGKLEEAMRFTVSTPGDLLNYPARLAMVRADYERTSRAMPARDRYLRTMSLKFSDALFVDLLFYEEEMRLLLADGADVAELWERAVPWWRAAYARESEAVEPIIRAWIDEGSLVETTEITGGEQ